jgi:hypothetical protein
VQPRATMCTGSASCTRRSMRGRSPFSVGAQFRSLLRTFSVFPRWCNHLSGLKRGLMENVARVRVWWGESVCVMGRKCLCDGAKVCLCGGAKVCLCDRAKVCLRDGAKVCLRDRFWLAVPSQEAPLPLFWASLPPHNPASAHASVLGDTRALAGPPQPPTYLSA